MNTLKINKIVNDVENVNYSKGGDVAIDIRAAGVQVIIKKKFF